MIYDNGPHSAVLILSVLLIQLSGGRAADSPVFPKPNQSESPRLVAQMGHTDSIRWAAFFLDGKQVLTRSDEAAVLWDVDTGKEIKRFKLLTDKIDLVAWTVDGKRILTGSSEGTAVLWDVDTGKEIKRFKEIKSAAFSPDGKQILTGSSEGTAVLWDAESGKEVKRFRIDMDAILTLAFSPDGKRILTGSLGSWGPAVLWDADTGKEIKRLPHYKGPTGKITSLAFSPDGKQIRTGSSDGVEVLWDADTGKEVKRFKAHADAIESVAFSRDGKWKLTGISGGAAILWDADTGKEVKRFEGHLTAPVVAFSPNGKQILTGCGWDKKAILWDVETGNGLKTFKGHTNHIKSVAFSPDGQRILTSSNEAAVLWDAQTGKEARRFKTHIQSMWAVAFSPDGKRILTGSSEGAVVLWDAETGKEANRFNGHTGLVSAAKFSTDGRRILTGSWDRTAVLWDADTGKEIRRFKKQATFVNSVAFSPDGKRILTGSEATVLWDAETGEEIKRIEEGFDFIHAVAFSADGKRIIAGSENTVVRDADTGKEVMRIKGQITTSITSVEFSPDGKQILTASMDTGAVLSNSDTGEEIKRFNLKTEGNGGAITWATFSAEGKRILTGSRDKKLVLWDADTGEKVKRFEGRPTIVRHALSPDGTRVLTSDSDGTTVLWSWETGKELCSLIFGLDGFLVVTPDNRYLASRGGLQAVAFRVHNRAYPFEQFDLKFNRPDLVLKQIGLAPKELIDAYHQAHLKRLKKLNFTEEMLGDDFHMPEVALVSDKLFTTNDRSLKLTVRASDAKYLLDRLNVSVNGSPLRGVGGIDLRDKKAKAWEGGIDVELSTGKNTIQVSALNEKGAESLRETFNVACEAPAAKSRVYAVVVGVSEYQDAKRRLDYAAKDAKDLADFFEKNPMRFGEAKVVRCIDKDATRETILKAKEVLQQAGVDDLVIVFFAGHGLLDKDLDYQFASVDVDFGDPAKRGVAYAEIEGLLDGIKARRKLLLMDTCHSGEVDKEEVLAAGPHKVTEGMVQARGFRGVDVRQARLGTNHSAELMREMFTDLRRGTGVVAVAAAGGLQYALESKEWQNGVFTYALLRGLGGAADKNKDGKVQVSELRDYVLEEVRRLTDGRQAPTVRRENLDFDFPLDSAAR
jgi:WD40 repeat protein